MFKVKKLCDLLIYARGEHKHNIYHQKINKNSMSLSPKLTSGNTLIVTSYNCVGIVLLLF